MPVPDIISQALYKRSITQDRVNTCMIYGNNQMYVHRMAFAQAAEQNDAASPDEVMLASAPPMHLDPPFLFTDTH